MFKIMGITQDIDTCECCGRTGLKKTVILGRLDADKNVTEVLYFGCQCAADATRIRNTAKGIETMAIEAQRQAEEEKTRRVVALSDTGVNVTWVVESVGSNGGSINRLCFAKGLRSEVYAWAEKEYPTKQINVRKAI